MRSAGYFPMQNMNRPDIQVPNDYRGHLTAILKQTDNNWAKVTLFQEFDKGF